MALAKILFVDDEDYVLKAICRFFRGVYDVQTASSAHAGLEMLTSQRDYAAVVADVRMPGMSGIDFLRHAHEFTPRTTRVLLTGQISTEDALRAVNEGHVFQILMKPCPVATMHLALEAAVRHHRSHGTQASTVEHSQGNCTVKLLCEILATVSPLASARAKRITELAVSLAERMGIDNGSEIETSALLSQFGCIGIPGRVVASVAGGAAKCSEADAECFLEHPAIASRLLGEIPQLREIARGIELQLRDYDGSTGSQPSGDDLPISSRILRAVTDFDTYAAQHTSPQNAIAIMMQRAACYDPKVLRALKELNHIEDTPQYLELDVDDIRIGMTLECAVGTTDGRTLLAKGSQVTHSMLSRLRAFASNGNVVQPILVSVLVPQVVTTPADSSISAPETAPPETAPPSPVTPETVTLETSPAGPTTPDMPANC